MTTDKYKTPFEASLERTLQGIESGVSDVKKIVTGMYKQLGDLAESAEAIYDVVTANSRERDYAPHDDWDLMDENEEQ